jgi:hypothetical protein
MKHAETCIETYLMAMSPAEMDAPTTQAGMQVASKAAHPRPHSSSPRRQLTPPPLPPLPPLQLQLLRTQSATLLLLLCAPADAAAVIRPWYYYNLAGCHECFLVAVTTVSGGCTTVTVVCGSVTMTLVIVLPRSNCSHRQAEPAVSLTPVVYGSHCCPIDCTAAVEKSPRGCHQVAIVARADAPWKCVCNPAMRIRCKSACDTRLRCSIQLRVLLGNDIAASSLDRWTAWPFQAYILLRLAYIY